MIAIVILIGLLPIFGITNSRDGFLADLLGQTEAFAAEICNVGSPSGGDDTSKIQRAIDNCPSGGIVMLEAGRTYTAGSIYLKSNTTLKFGSANTVLQAHSDANKIDIGQEIKIPSKSELLGEAPPPLRKPFEPPVGLDQIIQIFGDIKRIFYLD